MYISFDITDIRAISEILYFGRQFDIFLDVLHAGSCMQLYVYIEYWTMCAFICLKKLSSNQHILDISVYTKQNKTQNNTLHNTLHRSETEQNMPMPAN